MIPEEIYSSDSRCRRPHFIPWLPLHIICHSVSPSLDKLWVDHGHRDVHGKEQLHDDVGSVFQEEAGDGGDHRGQQLRSGHHGHGHRHQLLCQEIWLETRFAGYHSPARINILHWNVLPLSLTLSSSKTGNFASQESNKEDQMQEGGKETRSEQVCVLLS